MKLKLIADQVHSGIALTEMDFGVEPMKQMDKLYQVYLALRKFPNPNSASNGSNEVVMPSRQMRSGPHQNINKLEIAKASPMPTLPPKTRLKLTRLDLERKEQLEHDLLKSEADLLEANEGFRAGSGDWGEVVRVDRGYRQLLDEANTFIAVIHADQRDFYAEHSTRWQKSEKGQAYHQWMDEWDVEISSDELPDPKFGGDLELCALEMLQDLPPEPGY